MSQFLGYDRTWLEQHGAIHTAKEISHQPLLWKTLIARLHEQQQDNNRFLCPLFAKPDLKIILTGAGTSAYAGAAISPWLHQNTSLDVSAIATTDIVSNPYEYLDETRPTLLVSFARSGNSPESVAAVNLVDQLVPDTYHLILTCNPEGELYRYAQNNDKALCQLMPDGANDQSFAMTSSYSCMTLAAITLLGSIPSASVVEAVADLAEVTEKNLLEWQPMVKALAKAEFDRLIYLGSGGLAGVAQEAALKALELTAGKVVTKYDSTLGFRHGPKFSINENAVVIQLFSSNPYTSRYDRDLYNEIKQNNIAKSLIALTNTQIPGVEGQVIDVGLPQADDIWLTFPYIVFAQMLAMEKSLALGFTPDNPCPTGEVNRVVQGVTIYPYSQNH